MSEWRTVVIEQDGYAYAKDVLISDDDPQIRIDGSRVRGESARLGSIWISKKQIKEIHDLIFS